MLWYCIAVFIGSIVLAGLLKGLGIQTLIMGGSAYTGALIILDWLNRLNGGGLGVMLTCSVIYIVAFAIIWATQTRLNSTTVITAMAVCVTLFYWLADSESFLGALVIATVLSVIMLGLHIVLSIWAEEFTTRWDLELPLHEDGPNGRCPKCHSSRVSKTYYGEGGQGYHWKDGSYVEEDFTCRRCGRKWHHNFGQVIVH